MHFIVQAYDFTDEQAQTRRLAVREQHLSGVRHNIRDCRHLFGAALLDEQGQMIGSMMIVDYADRDALTREWLDTEPYITGKVWDKIDIRPCKAPDFFIDKSLA